MWPGSGGCRYRSIGDPPETALIPEIHDRGTKVGGLLAYLSGHGKREEHRNPHLVAAWDGAGPLAGLQPPRDAAGRHSVRRLIELLEQPVRAVKSAPPLTVWHCSVRTHPTDRVLSDQQWQHIAAEIMAGVGLAPHGDQNAVRWVAVRHADDHIHIVATLVRQDGRVAWAWNDKPKAQAVARDLEQRYNLYRVGPVDNTSHYPPTAAEQNKAERQGRPEVPRDRLRREVRAASAAATDEAGFFGILRAAGVLVRLRHSTVNPDEVTGYAVGLPDHHTAAGETIWYGGGRLAPDLTLPKLRQRWDPSESTQPPRTASRSRPQQRASTFARAASATRAAAEHLARHTADDEFADVPRGAADVLTATAHAFEGRTRGRLSEAAESFDRAAREPLRRTVQRSSRGTELRAVSRLIFVMGRLTGDKDTAAALQLVLQMSILADTLADLRESQRRLHQARAARQAAEALRGVAAASAPARPSQPSTDPSATPTPTPAVGRPPRSRYG